MKGLLLLTAKKLYSYIHVDRLNEGRSDYSAGYVIDLKSHILTSKLKRGIAELGHCTKVFFKSMYFTQKFSICGHLQDY